MAFPIWMIPSGKNGVGRDDGKFRGEHCSILYLKDRFKLDKKDCGTFWFSDTPEKIASKSWGNEIPRICTWVRLIEKKTNKGFYVYNVHYDHRSDNITKNSRFYLYYSSPRWL